MKIALLILLFTPVLLQAADFFPLYPGGFDKSFVYVDSFKVNDRGESAAGYSQPMRLTLIGAESINTLTYRDTVEEYFPACSAPLKRILWRYTPNAPQTSGVAAVTTDNVQIRVVDRSAVRPEPMDGVAIDMLKAWADIRLPGMEVVSPTSPSPETLTQQSEYASVRERTWRTQCQRVRWDVFDEISCPDVAILFRDGRPLVVSSVQTTKPRIQLHSIVTIDNEPYYVISTLNSIELYRTNGDRAPLMSGTLPPRC